MTQGRPEPWRGRAARALGVAAVLCAAAAARALAVDQFQFDSYVELDLQAEKAISKAQEWIAGQQRSDGSWPTGHGRNNMGEISYALLALMVNGSVPGEGKYSEQIGRGIQFLLNSQRENGLIAGASEARGPMYQHALATLALLECYGMTANPRTRGSIIKAVNLIVATQHSAGGWRYDPRIEPGDISITVMQVMALRAAVEAGLYVPDETIERAIKFIRGCYNKTDGGFTYMPSGGAGGGSAFPRTGAGMVCLQTVGLHDDPVMPKVADYLLQHAFADGKGDSVQYWYGHYYTSVGLYHFGGTPWQEYYPKVRKRILDEWGDGAKYRGVLLTAWQVLVLGVPYRYLPIYQR